jgi:hypothetical protein
MKERRLLPPLQPQPIPSILLLHHQLHLLQPQTHSIHLLLRPLRLRQLRRPLRRLHPRQV